MIYRAIALIAVLALTACSQTEVVLVKDCPRQGGIGGTGGTGECLQEQDAP